MPDTTTPEQDRIEDAFEAYRRASVASLHALAVFAGSLPPEPGSDDREALAEHARQFQETADAAAKELADALSL